MQIQNTSSSPKICNLLSASLSLQGLAMFLITNTLPSRYSSSAPVALWGSDCLPCLSAGSRLWSKVNNTGTLEFIRHPSTPGESARLSKVFCQMLNSRKTCTHCYLKDWLSFLLANLFPLWCSIAGKYVQKCFATAWWVHGRWQAWQRYQEFIAVIAVCLPALAEIIHSRRNTLLDWLTIFSYSFMLLGKFSKSMTALLNWSIWMFF